MPAFKAFASAVVVQASENQMMHRNYPENV